MKLKAQILPPQDAPPSVVTEEGVVDLEIQLKELGLDDQKIQEIVNSMKAVVPSTTNPQGPPIPFAPEPPTTGVQPTPTVMQPGKPMTRLQYVEEIFEDKVEEYLDGGEDFDIAVHKAHKHLDKVIDYLEIQGQGDLRELQGPAKRMSPGGSLYDQLFEVSGDPNNEKVLDALRVKFDTLLGNIEGILEESGNTELIIKLNELEGVYEDLEEIGIDRIADSEYLVLLMEEIKQVALDIRGGSVDVVDIGEWLY